MPKRLMFICSLAVFAFLASPAYANDRPCDKWDLESVVGGKLSRQKQLIIVPRVSDKRPYLLLHFDRDTMKENGDVIWGESWALFAVSLAKITVVKDDRLDNTRALVFLIGGCRDDSGHLSWKVQSVVVKVSEEFSLKYWKEIIARAQKLYKERNTSDVLPEIEEEK